MQDTYIKGERLYDLRIDCDYTLEYVANATDLSVSTIQRLEMSEETGTSYKALCKLAIFYDVSADYLLGLSEHLHKLSREIPLRDNAVKIIKDKQFNNRILADLIEHPNFPKLINSLEVYLERHSIPTLSSINLYYKTLEEGIRKEHNIDNRDETLAILSEAVVQESEIMRFRVNERFNRIVNDLYRKYASPRDKAVENEQNALTEMILDMVEGAAAAKKGDNFSEHMTNSILSGLQVEKSEVSDEDMEKMAGILGKSAFADENIDTPKLENYIKEQSKRDKK